MERCSLAISVAHEGLPVQLQAEMLATLQRTCTATRTSLRWSSRTFMHHSPFSTNVWQEPPALSCCSSTKTFRPARDSIAAVVKPPIPLPMMIASRSDGTCSDRNPCFSTLSLLSWSVSVGRGGRWEEEANILADKGPNTTHSSFLSHW